MTSYMAKRLMRRGYKFAAAELLCRAYNAATNSTRRSALSHRRAELILAKIKHYRLPHSTTGDRLQPYHW